MDGDEWGTDCVCFECEMFYLFSLFLRFSLSLCFCFFLIWLFAY